mmetsp:Transcript_21515/g.54205  ORF Transcript_21515/g.54205 Transcript_21515/m.54205 type:complete len:231 (+) Transcript_21515:175-867(+)
MRREGCSLVRDFPQSYPELRIAEQKVKPALIQLVPGQKPFRERNYSTFPDLPDDFRFQKVFDRVDLAHCDITREPTELFFPVFVFPPIKGAASPVALEQFYFALPSLQIQHLRRVLFQRGTSDHPVNHVDFQLERSLCAGAVVLYYGSAIQRLQDDAVRHLRELPVLSLQPTLLPVLALHEKSLVEGRVDAVDLRDSLVLGLSLFPFLFQQDFGYSEPVVPVPRLHHNRL